jgi:hypothetical protein
MTDKEYESVSEIIKRYGEENRPPSLWSIMRDRLGFSIDMCDEIVDAVEDWLPKEHDTNPYQWNNCCRLLKEKLR